MVFPYCPPSFLAIAFILRSTTLCIGQAVLFGTSPPDFSAVLYMS